MCGFKTYMHPPKYDNDYFLYLAPASSAITMVLVKDDDEGHEHIIYYLSRNLLDAKTHYAHVEKLALATVQVVQRFQHYTILRTTTMISDCNPMNYILTRHFIGGKCSSWIFIL